MSTYNLFIRRAEIRCAAVRLQPRRGVVLICALVCLSVATVLIVSLVQQSLIARRQGRMQWQLRQTEYLLDAGIRRAVAHLDSRDDYAGETWQPAAALPGFKSVAVEIAVTPSDDDPSRRKVTVQARLDQSESLAFRTQRSHSFLYPTADQTEASQSE